MIQDFQDHSAVPVDGESLSEAMHSRGINIRYLGRVAQLLSQQSSLIYLYVRIKNENMIHWFIDLGNCCQWTSLSKC